MTFINNNKTNSENSVNYSSSDITEANYFKKIIIISSFVLLLIMLIFVKSFYFSNSVKASVELKKTVSNETFNNKNLITENKFVPIDLKVGQSLKENFLKSLTDEDIFQIASSNPEGFYVMVGSFENYKNAISQQSMNKTEYTCHIFEPNYQNINRVGLFISKENIRKAKNALTEIRNMQEKSWLLYNVKN